MKALRTLTLAIALGALASSLAACSGDDTNTSNPTDASTPTDGSNLADGSHPGDSSPGDGSTSDGGAPDFSVFVIGLITDHTNAKDSPVPLPADGAYSDNQSLTDYPATFF